MSGVVFITGAMVNCWAIQQFVVSSQKLDSKRPWSILADLAIGEEILELIEDLAIRLRCKEGDFRVCCDASPARSGRAGLDCSLYCVRGITW